MKRIYYLTRSLSSVLGISKDLHDAGIGDNRIHVMGNNQGVLEQAGVHTATLWEETDIMHLGFLGALWGGAFGMLGGFMLAGLDPWGMELGGGMVMVATLFGVCLGAWLGGILGISTRNHHLRPFLARVQSDGDFLVMVDADDDRMLKSVEQVMHERHREARQAGREDHYSPFF